MTEIRKEENSMFRKWIQLIVLSLLVISLVGCGQSLDTQLKDSLSLTKTVLADEPEKVTETVGRIQFYLPYGFKVEKTEDNVNILLSKDDNSYILFVNKHEDKDSKLLYALLKQDDSKKIIEETTFEQNNVFGFSAVVKNAQGAYEVIASYGGVKMTTLSTEKEIAENIEDMLKIVRSVKLKEAQ